MSTRNDCADISSFTTINEHFEGAMKVQAEALLGQIPALKMLLRHKQLLIYACACSRRASRSGIKLRRRIFDKSNHH